MHAFCYGVKKIYTVVQFPMFYLLINSIQFHVGVLNIINAGGISHGVNDSKLPLPVCRVEKLPQVESVVVW